MAELSFDNIFTADEAESLFAEDIQESSPEKEEPKEDLKESEDKKETTEVDPETLFEEEEPESVGSGNNKDKEDADSNKGSTSPNFYSSIAKALTEEGIFPDLDDTSISKVKTPEDFRDLIEKQIQAGLDERQKRIDDALSVGIEPSEIKKYEGALSYLDNLSDEDLSDESEKGENLRKNLIYQDFINRGYSKERANKEVQKSIKGGTDLEDAKDALLSNKEYFQEQYDNLIQEARDQEEANKRERKQQAEALKTSILTDNKVFGEVEIDKKTRQKIYDNITKPVFRDPDSGEYMTAIQKYERDNSTDFLKYVGFLFTLTDGFKDFNGLVKSKVKKEVNKGMRELEAKLSGTLRTSDGNLRFANGAEDPESWLKDYSIDI